MRRIAGFILIGFAAIKISGLAVVLCIGSVDRPIRWYDKQIVFAVAAATLGCRMVRKYDARAGDD